MNHFDAALILTFISSNYDLFQQHLESYDIEGAEIELIIHELDKIIKQGENIESKNSGKSHEEK